jgi:hypothetical protein
MIGKLVNVYIFGKKVKQLRKLRSLCSFICIGLHHENGCFVIVFLFAFIRYGVAIVTDPHHFAEVDRVWMKLVAPGNL